jgi:hypothetical protein
MQELHVKLLTSQKQTKRLFFLNHFAITSNLIPHHTKYQYTHNRVHSQYHFHTKTQQPEKARIRIDWVQTHSTLNYIPSSSSLHTYHTSSTSTAFSHSWVLITPIFYFLKPLPLAVWTGKVNSSGLLKPSKTLFPLQPVPSHGLGRDDAALPHLCCNSPRLPRRQFAESACAALGDALPCPGTPHRTRPSPQTSLFPEPECKFLAIISRDQSIS